MTTASSLSFPCPVLILFHLIKEFLWYSNVLDLEAKERQRPGVQMNSDAYRAASDVNLVELPKPISVCTRLEYVA